MSLPKSEIIQTADLIDMLGLRTELSISKDWNLYISKVQANLGVAACFVFASLLEVRDKPILNADLNGHLTNIAKITELKHSGVRACPLMENGELNVGKKGNALSALEYGAKNPVRNHIFRVGYNAKKGSFMFLCTDVSDINFGAELIAKGRRDAGVTREQTRADVGFFALEFNRRRSTLLRRMKQEDDYKMHGNDGILDKGIIGKVFTRTVTQEASGGQNNSHANTKDIVSEISIYGQNLMDSFLLRLPVGSVVSVHDLNHWLKRELGVNARDEDLKKILSFAVAKQVFESQLFEDRITGAVLTRYKRTGNLSTIN